MPGGGHRMYASANFVRLVLVCINAEFCNQILSTHVSVFVEIYKICTSLHRSKLKNKIKVSSNCLPQWGTFWRNFHERKEEKKGVHFMNFVSIR